MMIEMKRMLMASLAVPAAVWAGVTVTCDRESGLYTAGEEATFTVTVTDAAGTVRAGTAKWTLDNFGAKKITAGESDLAAGNPFVVKGRLAEDGFLRLGVQSGTNTCTFSVGYDVGSIRQTTPRPADFDAYWQSEKARLAREVPLDPRCEKADWLSKRAQMTIYRISFATFGGKRLWGFMSVPDDRSKAPFRTRVRICDAGYGAIGPWEANESEVTVTLNVHYFEPGKTAAEQKKLIDDLNKGIAEKYGRPGMTYRTAGIDGARGDCYFHDAIVGLARAIDWLAERPEVDPARIVYFGSSQGGGFGLFVNYLNPRFSRACFAVPAITGHFGHRQERADGWPNYISFFSKEGRAAAERNASYYDGVNFAAGIKHPVRFVVGFADTCCPPPDVYAAYNICPSKDKAIINCIGAGHCEFGGWVNRNRAKLPQVDFNAWLRAK